MSEKLVVNLVGQIEESLLYFGKSDKEVEKLEYEKRKDEWLAYRRILLLVLGKNTLFDCF